MRAENVPSINVPGLDTPARISIDRMWTDNREKPLNSPPLSAPALISPMPTQIRIYDAWHRLPDSSETFGFYNSSGRSVK
jgi:hypothetical protein